MQIFHRFPAPGAVIILASLLCVLGGCNLGNDEMALPRLSYEEEVARSEAYLAEAANQAGAVKTGSGLIYREIVAGTGSNPTASNVVRVHYRGTLVDGTEFDSSLGGEPLEFPLTRVIPCWTEGVQMIRVGGKAELVCPAAIAYGDRGAGTDIPPGAALIFEVELLDIVQ